VKLNGSKLQILRVAEGVQDMKVSIADPNRTLLHSPILPEAALPFVFCFLRRSAPLGLGMKIVRLGLAKRHSV